MPYEKKDSGTNSVTLVFKVEKDEGKNQLEKLKDEVDGLITQLEREASNTEDEVRDEIDELQDKLRAEEERINDKLGDIDDIVQKDWKIFKRDMGKIQNRVKELINEQAELLN